MQGLREPVNDQDSIYLNRANDGFVFFDNGCYTYGPIKRQEEDDDDKYLQSLMVGNFKSRVVMFGNGQGDESSAILQWKKSGSLFDEKSLPKIETEFDPCAVQADFVETIMCSMASPMQPWMLQRAKWQKVTFDTHLKSSSEEEYTSLDDSRIRCWSLAQSAAEFYNWLWPTDDTKEEGTVVQAGTLCEANGQ